MKVPLSWLKEFINIHLSPEEIGHLLTMAGLEVDAIHSTPLSFQGIVVGKVVDVIQHPDAEKLVIATVSDGHENFQVVCGAPNCRPGIKTAFAKIGATLKLEDGQSLKIKKGKLRGIESLGMLCSGKELGISEEEEGIVEFPEHYQVGKNLQDFFSDAIFEISLTPNLNHCSSIVGIAREISALTAEPIHLKDFHPLEDAQSKIEDQVSVVIEDSENCPRYACRLTTGVKIGPSPQWLQQRLLSIGMRPVNNVVDATNYVLMEYGQPLHAFDFDKIEGSAIIVKQAKAGDHFTTLDHFNRILTSSTTLICDSKKAIAIAGVMGGLDAEISENTTNVLIESAYFKPASIRKTSKEQGLMTEASKRYERGADPQQVVPSLERVCSLIQEVAGGTAAAGMIDRKDRQFNSKTITCRLNRINQLLGTQLALSEVETILQRLQCRLAYEGQNVLHVQVPTYRGDLNSEVDLIEETARIYGYNHIPKPSAKYHSSTIPHAPIFLFEREIRARLLGEGLQEFLTCDLINPVMMEKIKAEHIQAQSIIQILNPNSIDQSILRPTLLPGLLELVKYNIDHKNGNICGFEVGRIHFKQNDQCKEQSMAGIILSGMDRMPHWDAQPTEVDFYDLKGIVENLVNSLGISPLLLTSSHLKSFHPSRQGSLQIPSGTDRNQTEIFKAGILGEIHPAVLRAWGIPHRVFYAEINLHDLFQAQRSDHLVKDLPQFPSSDRDWTVTLPEELLIDEVFTAINAMKSPILEKLSLLKIHRSEKIGPNVKNATFRLIYRSPAKTLSFDEVEAEHARIVNGTVKMLRI